VKANCSRCRTEGDYTQECYAKIAKEVVEVTKSTVPVPHKRKRDDDEESSLLEKWSKVAAIEIEDQTEKRFWENKSKEEDLETRQEMPQLDLFIFVG
jgi:hypothetical protein